MKIPLGFQKADSTIHPRIIISVEGLAKNGKSHFALTAPGPMCYMNLDSGLEGVIHKFAAKKEIYVSNYDTPISLKDAYPDLDKTVQVWGKFKQDFVSALHSGLRTLIVDTTSEAYELVRLARLGKLTQVKPFHYALPNYEFKALLDEALKNPTVNVIFLHKQKRKYVKDVWNGGFERAGFGGIEYIVQAFLRTFYDEDGFNIEILDSRHDKELAGTVLTGNDVCNFQNVAMMLMPDVDPGMWE